MTSAGLAIAAGGVLLAGLAAASQTETGRDMADALLDGFTDLPTPEASANVRAFLAVIRAGEGTADANGYRRMFGGALFDGFDDHPRRAITKTSRGQTLTSTAAGAYQFLSRTWDECRAALDLPDFSPASQDRAALYLIRRRGALSNVLAGEFEEAVRKCAKEWASLPGSTYGQPTTTIDQARAIYEAAGGVYA